MKNKILRNTILTIAISSAMVVPVFAQNINVPKLGDNIEIMPINYVYSHWAEVYLEKLSNRFDLEGIFSDKNLDDYISREDFIKVVKLIDEEYENDLITMSREEIVFELTKIWAEKSGKDLDNLPIIKMLIYSDTSDIDLKYKHGIYLAYMHDIAKGREVEEAGRIFDPKTEVTYGELVVLINNTVNAIEKELETVNQPILEGRYETRASYEVKEDSVVFDFELMSHFAETQELMFGSGQQFELTITNEDGEEVYRFSDGKFFTLALVYKTLEPGESIKWQDKWNMINKDGEKLTSGNYKAEIKVLPITEENEEIPEDQLTAVIEFSLNK